MYENSDDSYTLYRNLYQIKKRRKRNREEKERKNI